MGRELALGLKKGGYEVSALSTLASTSGRTSTLESAGVKIIKCDILSGELNEVMLESEPDVVVHAAGLIAAKNQETAAADYARINVAGTSHVLAASERADAKQFVYRSTTAVYGKAVSLPIGESHPTNPIGLYGSSKLEAEKLAEKSREVGMRVFIPRIFNAYGPDPTRPEVVSQTIKSVSKHEQPALSGGGKPTRDFVYVSDVVEAVQAGIKNRLDTTLNVATGRETSLLQLAELVISIMGSDLKPKLMPSRRGGVDRNFADVSKAHTLGIKAKVSLEEGIGRLIRH